MLLQKKDEFDLRLCGRDLGLPCEGGNRKQKQSKTTTTSDFDSDHIVHPSFYYFFLAIPPLSLMVSLFNRVRNSSSKNLQTSTSATLPGSSSSNRFDEFGQIGGSPSPQPFSTPQPKSKSQRARTISTPGPPKDLPSVPDSGFLPFHIPTKTGDPKVSPEYGYLSAESDVILSVEQANHLVLTVGNEIISQCASKSVL